MRHEEWCDECVGCRKTCPVCIQSQEEGDPEAFAKWVKGARLRHKRAPLLRLASVVLGVSVLALVVGLFVVIWVPSWFVAKIIATAVLSAALSLLGISAIHEFIKE